MNLPANGNHSAFYAAVSQADADLEDALGHVRAEEDAGRILQLEACLERVRLLEDHLGQCQRLRREHLGTGANHAHERDLPAAGGAGGSL